MLRQFNLFCKFRPSVSCKWLHNGLGMIKFTYYTKGEGVEREGGERERERGEREREGGREEAEKVTCSLKLGRRFWNTATQRVQGWNRNSSLRTSKTVYILISQRGASV